MGLRTKVFGLSDKEAYMQSNQTKAMFVQEMRQYETAIARAKEQIKKELQKGNNALVNQLAGSVAKYQAKRASLQEQISDIEAINMHAFSKISEEHRAGTDIAGLIRYGSKEAELNTLEEPYASKLRAATNGLTKAQEARAESVSGVVSEAYVPITAKAVLDDIMAEIETQKQQTEQQKKAVKDAAASAGSA